MEDVSLEELIADVVANPAPQRVPCAPATSTTSQPAPRGIDRSIRRFLGAIVRRVRSGRR